MKKIINGRVYDTSTAKKMGEWYYGHPGDMEYVLEQLYRKRTGEFFLYGFGGAATSYAEKVSHNEVSEGEKIRPLSIRKAQEWAERRLDGDEFEAIFGETPEEELAQIATYIPKEVKEKIDTFRREFGCTIADVVLRGVEALENE